ncbi:MAG: transposase [Phycisphaeraceae bacterium]
MSKRKRFEVKDQPRFITCSCFSRMQLFSNDRIKDAFVEELAKTQSRLQFQLHAWVVMPEHIHLLLTPDVPNNTLTNILQDLKSRTAGRVLRRWYELDAPILNRLRDKQGKAHFWLAGGGYDRNIFSADEYEEKLHYIHRNPVVRGLVGKPVDWKWSSASAYANRAFETPLAIRPLST